MDSPFLEIFKIQLVLYPSPLHFGGCSSQPPEASILNYSVTLNAQRKKSSSTTLVICTLYFYYINSYTGNIPNIFLTISKIQNFTRVIRSLSLILSSFKLLKHTHLYFMTVSLDRITEYSDVLFPLNLLQTLFNFHM